MKYGNAHFTFTNLVSISTDRELSVVYYSALSGQFFTNLISAGFLSSYFSFSSNTSNTGQN